MLEEKRLRLMIRLARYEQQDGKDDLKISKYYRRDYVAFALLKNFFLITVTYALVLGMIIMYHLDFLLDHIHPLDDQMHLMILQYVLLTHLEESIPSK